MSHTVHKTIFSTVTSHVSLPDADSSPGEPVPPPSNLRSGNRFNLNVVSAVERVGDNIP